MTGINAGDIYVRLLADAKGLDAGLSAGERRIGSFSKTVSKVGSGLTKGLTIPILAAASASAVLALDFERDMTKIRGLTGASRADMKLYTNSILEMAGAVGKSPKELAEALYFIASSGFSGAEALDVLRLSAQASAAGLGDTKTIADVATTAVMAYGKENITAAHAIDVLTAAVREGKAEPEEFAAGIGDVISTAKILGVEFDQVAASIASMTLAGVKTPEAITALNQVMLGLAKPTAEGAKLADHLGLSYAGLRDELKDKGVIEVLRTLQDATHGNIEEIAQLVPNIRGLKAMLALTGVDPAEVNKVYRDVANSGGDMAKALKAWTESDASKFDKAMGSLQAAGIRAGADLVPALADVAQGVGDVADAFSHLDPSTQAWIVRIALAVAAVGPLLSVGARLATIYTALTSRTAAAAAAQEALNLAQAGGNGKAGPLSKRAAEATSAYAPGSYQALTAAKMGMTGAAVAAPEAAAGMSAGAVAAAIAIPAALAAAYVILTKHANDAYYAQRRANEASSGQSPTGGDLTKGQMGWAAKLALQANEAKKSLDWAGKLKTGTLNKVIVDLELRGGGNAALNEAAKAIRLLRTEAAKNIDFTIDPAKPLASLQSIQARLMGLGMSAKTAYSVMKSALGKDVVSPFRRQLLSIPPVMNAVAGKVAAKHAQMAAVLMQRIQMGPLDASNTLATLNSIYNAMLRITGSANAAADAVARAVSANHGSTGSGGHLVRAHGGLDYLTSATRFIGGEGGREIAAWFPLNDPSRSTQLYDQLGAMLSAKLPGVGRTSSAGGSSSGARSSSRGGAVAVPTSLTANLYVDGQFMEAIAGEIVDAHVDSEYQSMRDSRRGY